jgi:hypothetical protein
VSTKQKATAESFVFFASQLAAFNQNNLFCLAIKAKLHCNKHQIGDQNKLFWLIKKPLL